MMLIVIVLESFFLIALFFDDIQNYAVDAVCVSFSKRSIMLFSNTTLCCWKTVRRRKKKQ